MKKLPSLSVFFPVYNDFQILPYLIAITYAVLSKLANTFEVIIVNDGSGDETKEVISYLKKHYKYLRVVEHKKNRGYGGAIQSGFKHARYEWVFYTDADGQYDPRELIKFVKKISAKTDAVNGFKKKRHDSWIRIIIGFIYNKTLQFIYKLPIRDVDCDYRLIRRAVLKKITLTSNSGMICLELIDKLAQQHARFKEAPVHHYPRPIGQSQFFKVTNIISTLQEHLAYFKKRRVPSDRIELSTKRL